MKRTRLLSVLALVVLLLVTTAGCGLFDRIDSARVVKVTLTCIQQCQEMKEKPFEEKSFEKAAEVKLFVDAINHADRIGGELDYGAIFRMTLTLWGGKSRAYVLNIDDREGKQRGLLIKLPDSGHGYSISEKESEKLRQAIYGGMR